jgi:hypothetical protein
VWLLPPGQRDWGRAMRAELAAIASPTVRRAFATGCLRAVMWPGQVGRAAGYAAIVAATLALATLSGAAGAFRVELIGLGLLAPVGLWRLGHRDAALGAVGAGRTARVARRACLAVLAGCLVVGIGTISFTLPRYGGGASSTGAAMGLTLVAGFLAVYTGLGLAVTSRAAAVPAVTLAAGGGFGAAAGLAWCVLMPFNQTLSVPGPWLAVGYRIALALVVLGAPAAASAVVRRAGRADQGPVAGACTGGLAALVILAGGWSTVWLLPGLLDSPLLDKGPAWRPPDVVEQVITGYFVVLVVAPLLGALVGWAVAGPGRVGGYRRGGHLAVLSGLAAGGALVLPGLNAMAGVDGTTFGAVGTTGVVFSPAGGTLLTSNRDYTWILWNVTDPAAPRRLRTFNDDVVYAPDGLHLASRNALWEIPDPARITRTAGFAGGEPVAYSADGMLLATHPTRTTTALWRVADPGRPALLATVPGGGDGGFFPDGHTFVAHEATATALWDVTDPARPVRLAVVDGGDGPLSPDGTVLSTNAAAGATLWNVADPAHPRRIGALAGTDDPDDPALGARPVFAPDSRTAATGDGGGRVALFDTATGARTVTLAPTPDSPNNSVQLGASDTLTTLAFSPDGRTLSVITGNATVSVWDLADPAKPVRALVMTRHTAGAGRVAFSPDTATVAGAATGGRNSITLWQLR